MTIWTPDPELGEGPRYRAIADQLARDIASGQLPTGARLPTHRALATQIGVTVGTVSRAYREAERLGLISGEVGRGTFVREQPLAEPAFEISDEEREALIDLSRNVPDPSAAVGPLREALAALNRQAELGDLLDYLPSAGSPRHRAAGARWLARSGLATGADEIVVTGGAQHAMWLALTTLAKPGDTVLSAELTYPGLIGLTRLLRVRLEGVALDEEGIRPDALEAACRAHAPRALYCIPTNQNPTAAVMSETRRREIADIARRHELALIEDDISGFLPSDAPPSLASFAPEQSFYVTSLSKCIAPGLRVGFLRAPSGHAERVATRLRSMMWMAPPLMAEIAAAWIEDGTAAELAEARRVEAQRRIAATRAVLGDEGLQAPPESYHVWLELPDAWRPGEFALRARERGVGVSPADAFVVGRAAAPNAVRLCVAAPRTAALLEQALLVLAGLIRAPGSAEDLI